MPSSHVVYEGMKEIKKNIDENEKTCPMLAYGKSKAYNEEQLKPWITGNSLLNASATCGNFNFKSCISNGSATVSNRSLV